MEKNTSELNVQQESEESLSDSNQELSEPVQVPDYEPEPVQVPDEDEPELSEPVQVPDEDEPEPSEPAQVPDEHESELSEPVQVPDEPEPEPSEPAQVPDEPEPSRKYGLKYAWWVLIAAILIFNLIANKYGLLQKEPDQHPAPKPVLELNHNVLDFEIQPVNSQISKEVTLTNKGKSPLVIVQLAISGKNAEAFKIPDITTPKIIPVNKKIVIPVTFVPTSANTFIADLEIICKERTGKVNLRGTGKNINTSEVKSEFPVSQTQKSVEK